MKENHILQEYVFDDCSMDLVVDVNHSTTVRFEILKLINEGSFSNGQGCTRGIAKGIAKVVKKLNEKKQLKTKIYSIKT